VVVLGRLLLADALAMVVRLILSVERNELLSHLAGSPTFYGTLQLIESMGLRVVEIPLHPRSGLDLDALETALRSFRIRACVVTPNFNTPLGCLMPDDAKIKLVGMLARRNVALIEDDIYGDLHFGPARPKPAKAWDKNGLVLLCASFTKTLAPGYRVGFIAPGRFQEQVERLKFAQTAARPTLPQLAIASFLESGGYERHVRTLRARLKQPVEQMDLAVATAFPPGSRISRPQGGSVLWVELPPGVHGIDLYQAAREQGILTVPGSICSAGQHFSLCLRLSAGQPFTPETARDRRAWQARPDQSGKPASLKNLRTVRVPSFTCVPLGSVQRSPLPSHMRGVVAPWLAKPRMTSVAPLPAYLQYVTSAPWVARSFCTMRSLRDG
jgi:DNA-binding transcriptional MocR family regulator